MTDARTSKRSDVVDFLPISLFGIDIKQAHPLTVDAQFELFILRNTSIKLF